MVSVLPSQLVIFDLVITDTSATPITTPWVPVPNFEEYDITYNASEASVTAGDVTVQLHHSPDYLQNPENATAIDLAASTDIDANGVQEETPILDCYGYVRAVINDDLTATSTIRVRCIMHGRKASA